MTFGLPVQGCLDITCDASVLQHNGCDFVAHGKTDRAQNMGQNKGRELFLIICELMSRTRLARKRISI
ncbi:MAG TPA: hypothetical protein VF233_12850 [Nitrososphaeraceae archaeon]